MSDSIEISVGSTEPIPIPNYPTSLVYRDDVQKERWLTFTSQKAFKIPYTADFNTINAFGLDNQFWRLLCDSNSDALGDSYQTYIPLVAEFISSFKLVRDTHDQKAIGWRFRIGNKECWYTRDTLHKLLHFPEEGMVPNYAVSDLNAFWKKISGMAFFEPDMSPKCISMGVWKYIHRLIAAQINTRRDLGSIVTAKDLEIMLAIDQKAEVDYTHILGIRFEEWQNPASQNKTLGGAVFITKIAMNEGFSLNNCAPRFKPLDVDRMVKCKMLETDRCRWIHDPKRSKKAVQGTRKRRRTDGEGTSREGGEIEEGDQWEIVKERLSKIETSQAGIAEHLRAIEALIRQGNQNP